jgi:hypothetical protein
MTYIGGKCRALFATRPIEAGERVLRVSGNLIITPDKLPMEVLELLPKGVSEWARLALFLLAEQHIGQARLYHSTSHIAVLHCLSINLMA